MNELTRCLQRRWSKSMTLHINEWTYRDNMRHDPENTLEHKDSFVICLLVFLETRELSLLVEVVPDLLQESNDFLNMRNSFSQLSILLNYQLIQVKDLIEHF